MFRAGASKRLNSALTSLHLAPSRQLCDARRPPSTHTTHSTPFNPVSVRRTRCFMSQRAFRASCVNPRETVHPRRLRGDFHQSHFTMGVNIGVACMCVVSVTKRLGSQEFVPSGSVLIDCASALTLDSTSVRALSMPQYARKTTRLRVGSTRLIIQSHSVPIVTTQKLNLVRTSEKLSIGQRFQFSLVLRNTLPCSRLVRIQLIWKKIVICSRSRFRTLQMVLIPSTD